MSDSKSNETPFNIAKIRIPFSLPDGYDPIYTPFVKSIENLLAETLIPLFFHDENGPKVFTKEPDSSELAPYFERLHQEVPIIHSTPFGKNQPNFAVIALFNAKNSHGVGRFMCDLYSRWLVPGKQLAIGNSRSMRFSFEYYPDKEYFLQELILNVSDLQDITLIKNNLPIVSRELRINTLAVEHTRHVISVKPLSLDQKKILIQENLMSLLDRSAKQDVEPSVFDYMHAFITKSLADDRVMQLKEQAAPLMQMRPTAFDRDVFSEMQQFVTQLKDTFTLSHDLRYLNRMISYHYIFRKIVSNNIENAPQKRHVSTKILRTTLKFDEESIPILGVLICLNFLNDNEVFEENHLMQAVQSILVDAELVPNSTIIDRRSKKRMRSIYLEIQKPTKLAFSGDEIKEIKKRLPLEIQNRIEGLIHPLFIYRNEEEIMRYILDLNRQLKYIHDLPQVIVNFHKQTSFDISFIIIMLRLRKAHESSLKEVFNQSSTLLKFYNHDVKVIGMLRKRYPKEAHVIEVRLDKKPFLRKDFSVDLYKARFCIISEITRLIGDVRDYNGGMIAKQYEVLSALKALLLEEGIHNDFLLENFFYSLTPNYMQSILSPVLLKKAFTILLNVLEHEFSKDTFFIESTLHDDCYILMIGAVSPGFKDLIHHMIDTLLTSAHEICYSWVHVYDIACVGFLLRYEHPHEYEHFHDTIHNTLRRWEKQNNEQKEDVSPLSFLDAFVDQR